VLTFEILYEQLHGNPVLLVLLELFPDPLELFPEPFELFPEELLLGFKLAPDKLNPTAI
jgi:hypothetical protein